MRMEAGETEVEVAEAREGAEMAREAEDSEMERAVASVAKRLEPRATAVAMVAAALVALVEAAGEARAVAMAVWQH